MLEFLFFLVINNKIHANKSTEEKVLLKSKVPESVP